MTEGKYGATDITAAVAPPDPAEPTAEQCSEHSSLGNGWYAIWYPQMGGYVGKAAVFVGGDQGCVDVLVWHDGEFPFTGSGEYGDARPARLHHCDVGQFREFANVVEALQESQES